MRNILAYFRAFLRWLAKREEIERIPIFPTVAVPDMEPDLLTRAQQTAVLEAIPLERRGIFLAMADLAIRVNEARALYVIDYEPADGDPAGWMKIQRAVKGGGSDDPIRGTKTGASATLPVSDRLAAWIEMHVTPGARMRKLLFPSPRGVMHTSEVLRYQWELAVQIAGVPAVGLYRGTRHSTATALREEGVEVRLIQQFLRHTDAKTTERYARARASNLVALVRKR